LVLVFGAVLVVVVFLATGFLALVFFIVIIVLRLTFGLTMDGLLAYGFG
jgi:hypothetical protein